MPESITFVVAMLASRGIAGLAARVAVLLKVPYTVERHIVLVNDHDRWSDDIIAPAIIAVLAARPDIPGGGPADLARFEERDTVRIRVTVTPQDRAMR
jgi:hypothetical protein